MNERRHGGPVTGESVPVPVPLALEKVAPLLDPRKWSEFTGLRISEPRVEAESSQGWHGTIRERFSLEVFGFPLDRVENILAVEFRMLKDRARVDYRLVACELGGLIVDEGYVEAVAASTFGSRMSVLRASKTLDWVHGALPARIARETNRRLLSAALTLGLVRYGVRALSHRLERIS